MHGRGIDFLEVELNKNPYVFRNFPFFNSKSNFTFSALNINLEVHHKIGKKGEIPNVAIKAIVNEERLKYPTDTIEIFTDGSKNLEVAGYGIFHGQLAENKSVQIIGKCSVFIAEAKAILEACKDIAFYPDDTTNFCIMTDSLSVLLALKEHDESYRKHYILNDIDDIVKILRLLGISINFMWIPSHIGIYGNEEADKLAKNALANPVEVTSIQPHLTDLHKILQSETFEKWKSRWDDSEKGRLCHSIIPAPQQKPWFHKVNMDRASIVAWNRIISNHTLTNDSLSRLKMRENPICECGANYQTIDHLIFECQLICVSRVEIIVKLEKCGLEKPFIIRDIIANCIEKNSFEPMKIINEFVRSNKIAI